MVSKCSCSPPLRVNGCPHVVQAAAQTATTFMEDVLSVRRDEVTRQASGHALSS